MLTGTRLADRYLVGPRLGGGGMADVYTATDEVDGGEVAVKVLRGIDDQLAARRFAAEIRITRRLSHPCVVRLFDAGEHDGSPYLVLERIAGGTLSTALGAGPLEPATVAALGSGLGSALAHAHAEGIVHRDVKPSNVLLDDRGPHLADFGIAVSATATRMTVSDVVAGSPGYVAPEQVLGRPVGPAADVYALGLVLLECLTGYPAFAGTAVEAALVRLTTDPVVPETVPAEWHALLYAMTARRPEDRPTAVQAATRLAELVGDTAPIAVVAPGAVPARRDRRVPAIAASAVAVFALSVVSLLSAGPQQSAVALSPGAAVTLAELVPPRPEPAPSVTPVEIVEGVADWVAAQRASAGLEVAQTKRSRRADAASDAGATAQASARTARQPAQTAAAPAPAATTAPQTSASGPAPSGTTPAQQTAPAPQPAPTSEPEKQTAGSTSKDKDDKQRGAAVELPAAAVKTRR